jgi:acyl carrier protein
MKEFEQEIREIIGEIIEVAPEEIGEDTNLVMELGADSMMALEILATIEKKFKIIIPEKELSNMITLSQIFKVVKSYMEG